mmetsp:Transcript_32993/g.53121  ORF Transcript_32993/g.53121 Transcript_32993/m.53121 type:complete len:100 (-) Transcript_32993:522-821(-)
MRMYARIHVYIEKDKRGGRVVRGWGGAMDLRHEHGVNQHVPCTHAHGIRHTHEHRRNGELHKWIHCAAYAQSALRVLFEVLTDLCQLKCAYVCVCQVSA